ncbi:MAG: cytochrome b/b6 domain-containing protein [Tabrizicola sp.]|jgi:cytochrome b|nr:cytochrome b/b6 domain-containing protein [Tabrizicola sp.]
MSTPQTLDADPSITPPRLWDPVVRLTHWGIAVSVLFNAALDEGGSLTHVSLGWLVMALLLLRLVWGVLGPTEARFSAFPPNPLAALRHLRDLAGGHPRDYPSHNPAGALMVYAFWAMLALVTVTGLIMTSGATPMQVADDKAAVASGDWSALIKESEAEDDAGLRHLAEETHEVAANLLLFLAALHVAGVALESRAMRRSLLAPMLLGSRRK